MIATLQYGRRRRFDANRPWETLLLHGDGSDGSTTFTDHCPQGNSVTAFGQAQIDTSQAQFSGASMQFDGTGDYLRIGNDGDFNFGSADFCVEFWLKNDGAQAAAAAFVGCWESSTKRSWAIYKNADSAVYNIYASSDGTNWDILNSVNGGYEVAGPSYSHTAFHHLAFGRVGTQFAFWQDRTYAAMSTSSAALYSGSAYLFIGADFNGNAALNGRIDEVRITKGRCPYLLGAGEMNVPAAQFHNAT